MYKVKRELLYLGERRHVTVELFIGLSIVFAYAF